MAVDVLMPKMGESVQEGTILRWLKQPGEQVERDEIIAEISTDKVDTEIPSPQAGVLLEILAPENATVGVGQVIARLGAEGEVAGGAAPAAPAPSAAPAPQPAAAEIHPVVAESPESVPAASAQPVPQVEAPAAAPAAAGGGASIDIVMPKMGESVQEGTILRWLKQPGEQVERDEIIAEISTDKVDTEIPSPQAGVLAEIVAPEGSTVEVGKVIARLGSAAGSAAPAAAASAPAPQAAPAPQPAAAPISAPVQAAPVQTAPAPVNGHSAAPVAAPAMVPAGDVGPIPRTSNGRFYSPLVRTIAEQERVGVAELDNLKGTGSEGRVTKEDLLAYVKNRTSVPAPQAAPSAQPVQQPQGAPAQAARPAAPAIQTAGTKDYGPEVEIIPMDRMRQLIAEHMVRSKHTSPHVTEVGEADVTGLVGLRESQKSAFEKREGIKLTYTPFLVAAIARALRENPWVNSSVDGTNVIVRKHVNVGVATALPDGNLIVPVVKDADRMNVTGLAHAVNDLASRARAKRLSPDDIAGGTFTLTNYGVFGLLHGAPIINQPQVAILGAGAIQKRPVVREIQGQDLIVIRSMIYLSLSHDHRVIDGLLGGKFLSDVIRILESFTPETML